MVTIIELDSEIKPLDLIEKNKRLVKQLKENGIDGVEINKILCDLQGLILPIPISAKGLATPKQIAYAKRHITPLTKSPAITKEEKEFLYKIRDRLLSEQELFGKKGNAKPVFKMKQGRGNVKSFKQAMGFQVVKLYKYILPFTKQSSLKQDIFKLIAELINNRQNTNYAHKEIKTLYKNNKKFL